MAVVHDKLNMDLLWNSLTVGPLMAIRARGNPIKLRKITLCFCTYDSKCDEETQISSIQIFKNIIKSGIIDNDWIRRSLARKQDSSTVYGFEDIETSEKRVVRIWCSHEINLIYLFI